MNPYLYYTLTSLGVLAVFITMAAYTTLAERKISAFIQQRPGPNRVGPWGLLQPLADALKLVFKEDIVPANANHFIHFIAPMLMASLAIANLAILPVTPDFIVFDSSFGVLYVLAINGIAVYAVTLGGWSSNSKYSLLGGMRSSAQMLSYELSMGMAIVSVILLTNALIPEGDYLRMKNIVEAQRGHWFLFLNPLGFLIFVTTAFAETNRTPFDLVEAEQELVGGYHTEYSSMKFGAFQVGEYLNMVVSSAIITTLFMGGYLGPFDEAMGVEGWELWQRTLWGLAMFVGKTAFWIFVFIWVRWTIPRFKYNQLMDLGWKNLFPLALANLFIVAIVCYFLAR